MEPPQKKRKIGEENASVINSELLEGWERTKAKFSADAPFPHAVLENFVDTALLSRAKEALEKQEWFQKNNDLYKFEQTEDLKLCKEESIVKLKDALYSPDFLRFLSNVTNIPLNSTIDMAGSRYNKGKTLLCHDDQLEGRRVAFILYLVPPNWAQTDGGHLNLFDISPQGQPNKIAKSILPQWNNFVFFSVSTISFHEVAEVLSDKTRLSISGWFHGDSLVTPNTYVEPEIPRAPPSNDQYVLSEWLAQSYLDEETIENLKEYFDSNSALALFGFLKIEKYRSIMDSLPGQAWSEIGPYSRRRYFTTGRFESDSSDVGPLKELKKFLTSATFAAYIQRITGVEPWKIFSETRQFRPSSYTLVHDNKAQHGESGLDVIFNLCDGKWPLDHGGFTSYMDEEEELITLPPCENSIGLVLRDEGCMSFVKYVEHTAPSIKSDIWMVIWEDPEKQESDSEDEEMLEAGEQETAKN